MHFIWFIVLALLRTALGQLNTLAQAKSLKYFGSATDNPEFSDSSYIEILSSSDFGQITVRNTQKWDAIEPVQDTFTYEEGDAVVQLAKTNGQLLRCHNLCCYSQLPGWVTYGSWTNATLTAALINHITNEVTHYKGECCAWDVVNEAFNDDGSYRSSVFYNTIGPEYIPIAFSAAAAADPSAKLYYHDYNIEFPIAKTSAGLTLVRSLQARKIRIDGVGLQAHFIVGETPSMATQTANLNTFTALGIEVAYTELDICFTSLPPTDDGLVQQATDYGNTVAACVAAKGGGACVGVTLWDYTDRYSWVPSVDAGAGSACPWDASLRQKEKVYAAIAGALGFV